MNSIEFNQQTITKFSKFISLVDVEIEYVNNTTT